jgi:hypothetical protein
MARITLSLDPEVIKEAKLRAKQCGTSVSALFVSMVRLMGERETSQNGPLTDSDYRDCHCGIHEAQYEMTEHLATQALGHSPI